MYVLAMWVAVTMIYQVNQYRRELQEFRGKVVFDVDKVRQTLYDEMAYMYMEGCRKGIDYPEEYRVSQNTFNPNSPPIYCMDQKNKLDDYVINKVRNIGR
jgi:hypothetical protein